MIDTVYSVISELMDNKIQEFVSFFFKKLLAFCNWDAHPRVLFYVFFSLDVLSFRICGSIGNSCTRDGHSNYSISINVLSALLRDAGKVSFGIVR